MKILYNKKTEQVVWRGVKYTVDGVEVTNFPPHILYLEEIKGIEPSFNPALEYLTNSWKVNENDMQYVQEYIVNLFNEKQLFNINWKYLEYSKRLVIEESVIFNPEYTQLYIFLQLEDFPMEKRGDKLYIWLNITKPEHQATIDYLISENLLKIEERE